MVGTKEVEVGADRISGSEDFSFMLAEVPGAYALIGNGPVGEAGFVTRRATTSTTTSSPGVPPSGSNSSPTNSAPTGGEAARAASLGGAAVGAVGARHERRYGGQRMPERARCIPTLGQREQIRLSI